MEIEISKLDAMILRDVLRKRLDGLTINQIKEEKGLYAEPLLIQTLLKKLGYPTEWKEG